MPAPKAVQRLEDDTRVATLVATLRGCYILTILALTVLAVMHILG